MNVHETFYNNGILSSCISENERKEMFKLLLLFLLLLLLFSFTSFYEITHQFYKIPFKNHLLSFPEGLETF